MKTLVTFLILLISSKIGFSQDKDSIESNPFEFSSSIIIDNVNNLTGGIENRSAFLALFDFNCTYRLFKNTSVNAHIIKTAGGSPSEQLIGDVQIASNVEGKSSRFLYELYLSQQLSDFNISLGLHDLNAEFAASTYAGDFINSSFGIFPAISLNVPVSIFPITTLGGIISYNKKDFDIVSGFYNLNHKYIEEESFTVENHFFNKGYITITELRYRWSRNNSVIGEYKIGGYFKQCSDPELSHNTEECLSKQNVGYYFIADQEIYQFTSGGSIASFLQIGLAPSDKNIASEYYGAGIAINNKFKNESPYQIGLAIGRVKLNNFENENLLNQNKYETIFELSGRINVLSKIWIQPDLQYVVSPSGVLNNAFIGLLRLNITLL